MNKTEIKLRNAKFKRIIKERRNELVKELYQEGVPITLLGEIFCLNKSTIFRIIDREEKVSGNEK